MDSKVLEIGLALGLAPATANWLILLTAVADSLPARIRGREGLRATARKGEFFAGDGHECSARLSQPSWVSFRPGVPDSMKSCASKWERVGPQHASSQDGAASKAAVGEPWRDVVRRSRRDQAHCCEGY